MLNRSQRRKLDREMKKRLTNDQYRDLKQDTVEEAIKLEVDKQVHDIFEKICEDLIASMKEHRISEDRIAKIMAGVVEKGKERKSHGKGLS